MDHMTLLEIIGYSAGSGLAAHVIQTFREPLVSRDTSLRDSIFDNWRNYLRGDGFATASTALMCLSYNIPSYIKWLLDC